MCSRWLFPRLPEWSLDWSRATGDTARPDRGAQGEGSPIGQLRRFGFGNLLVVAQVAICMALLICSGLFLRSYHSARNMDTGLANRNVS